MKRECNRFDEIIWEHARTGIELPGEVRGHLESCPHCRQALADATRLSRLLIEVGRVPDTPDCRSAVISRLSGRPRGSAVPAWAYAFAVVLIGAAVALGITSLGHKTPPPAPVVAKRTSATPQAPAAAVKSQGAGPQMMAARPVTEAKPGLVRTRRTVLRRYPRPGQTVERRTETVAALTDRLRPATIALTPDSQPKTQREVAAVYVTRPEWGESHDTSYQYVERDAETGETTACSVKRSGDRIEIYIETTPGGDRPPVKGSIQNGSTANA